VTSVIKFCNLIRAQARLHAFFGIFRRAEVPPAFKCRCAAKDGFVPHLRHWTRAQRTAGLGELCCTAATRSLFRPVCRSNVRCKCIRPASPAELPFKQSATNVRIPPNLPACTPPQCAGSVPLDLRHLSLGWPSAVGSLH